MLTEKDIQQIEKHGLTAPQIYKQIETFIKGIPYVDVVTSATVGNGIEQLGHQEQLELDALYEAKRSGLDIVKFIPASGAATRMFQFLHEFLESYNPEESHFRDYIKERNGQELLTFFGGLSEFAFINEVRTTIRKQFPSYKKSSKGQRYYYVARAMLDEDCLDYGNLPKGLIPFHRYKKYATTAFEEQLYEAAFYASASDDVYTHFTFSEKHLSLFKEEFERIKSRISRKTKKVFHISYSFQNCKTDTLAVTVDNKPLRDANEDLVFRPAGHGALLENLNEINADIVFIKNIDNVSAQEYVPEISKYKRILAGKLLQLQQKIFAFLNELNADVTLEKVKEIQTFIWNELNAKEMPGGITAIREFLNRPIRVCGVVKNMGAPGGGPFWVKNGRGDISLQIVEKSQIDLDDLHQTTIINDSTHFNPVDIVCGLRDYKGEKFDLLKFSNPKAGFISKKSENGTPIKALEVPGLWNGGMANWNTVFLEVPQISFNPVKTVNDLLKKEHRPNA